MGTAWERTIDSAKAEGHSTWRCNSKDTVGHGHSRTTSVNARYFSASIPGRRASSNSSIKVPTRSMNGLAHGTHPRRPHRSRRPAPPRAAHNPQTFREPATPRSPNQRDPDRLFRPIEPPQYWQIRFFHFLVPVNQCGSGFRANFSEIVECFAGNYMHQLSPRMLPEAPAERKRALISIAAKTPFFRVRDRTTSRFRAKKMPIF